MAGEQSNTSLRKAKAEKNDEFYTPLGDIEAELCHYRQHFAGKTVFCNCDDPEWSNFWKYFHANFADLGLKKLISTHYDMAGNPSYMMEYVGGNDLDITEGMVRPLRSNGDFRSAECIALLKDCDIVVTNPPFSLFREYVAQLMQYEKQFIIIGNENAVTYKEIFPLIKENQIWKGFNHVKAFLQPDGTYKKFGNVCWFTNLDITKRHVELFDLESEHAQYMGNEDQYPKYDNYDAINVDKTKDIPEDYFEPMGVPITFLDKYNPDEFEILGNLGSYGVDGYSLCAAIYINGQKVFKRILIRRKR